MSLMISISGLRGIVGSGLTPDVIVHYAAAFAEYCNRGPIVIGRDGRVTGKPITHIVSSTLLSMGCDVIALGVCPTPTVQLAVERLGAAGGISVTASHNPMTWNGLKFLAGSGMFLDADQNAAFWTLAEKPRQFVLWDKLGRHRTDESFLQQHIQAVLDLPYLNLRALRKRKFTVVADCVNAAGGAIIPALLRKLGCKVIEMNCDLTGVFAHDPEPVPQNLTALCRRVRAEKADLGIAVDPDVDRLVLIDEKGHPIGEEYTIASIVRFILRKYRDEASARRKKHPHPPVVINLSTTRAVDDIAREFSAPVIRTPVGEINVAKRMKETGALVGGEGSGGVILPTVHLGRDAPVGIGLALQHLAEFGGTMSELRKSLPDYAITKSKVDLGTIQAHEVLGKLADRYAGKGSVNTEDGLRIDFEDSWVHLRPSNTEPIIRIIGEARHEDQAKELVAKFTKEILG